MINPMDAPKMQESCKEHRYSAEYMDTTGTGSTMESTTGRWWPVWLICRTKKGWWTVSWYQLLDGSWVLEFWWYSDTHIHLLEAVR